MCVTSSYFPFLGPTDDQLSKRGFDDQRMVWKMGLNIPTPLIMCGPRVPPFFSPGSTATATRYMIGHEVVTLENRTACWCCHRSAFDIVDLPIPSSKKNRTQGEGVALWGMQITSYISLSWCELLWAGMSVYLKITSSRSYWHETMLDVQENSKHDLFNGPLQTFWTNEN